MKPALFLSIDLSYFTWERKKADFDAREAAQLELSASLHGPPSLASKSVIMLMQSVR
jgi:hypothetical protein